MRSKKMLRIPAAAKIDISRAILVAELGNRALQLITTASLVAVHLASLVIKAGSAK